MSCACDWPADQTCLPALPVLGDSPTDDDQAIYDAALADRDSALDMAVAVLWALSGRRFGRCAVTVRPCPITAGHMAMMSSFVRIVDDTGWRNTSCGCASHRCELIGPRLVHLPGPASDVTAVVIGGELLDADAYSLEGNVLYRIGADWPSQNLGRPLGEAGTWSVEYKRGERVPAGVGKLVGLLAGEFLAACSGSKCRLPRSVTNVTRNGVTYQVYDPSDIYSVGKTGLAEIDLWLSAINPNHLMSAPSVL